MQVVVLFFSLFFSVIVICGASLAKDKNSLKFALGFTIFIAVACGFIVNPSHWPSSYAWEHHFESALGGALGTWLGTSMVLGFPSWIIAIICVFLMLRQKKAEHLIEMKQQEKDNDRSKLLALKELKSGNVDKLTWANAVIAAEGDEVRAKAEYLKIRRIDKQEMKQKTEVSDQFSTLDQQEASCEDKPLQENFHEATDDKSTSSSAFEIWIYFFAVACFALAVVLLYMYGK